MVDLPAHNTCPNANWHDHVIETVERLAPVLDEAMDPSDRVVFIDNLFDDMCNWHLLAALYMFLGMSAGFGVSPEELWAASKSLSERDESTIPVPHP